MGLTEIIEAAEAVGDRDQERREAFREEFEAYEASELSTFTRTWDALEAEREALDELAAELDAEEGNIEELVDHAEFLTVDQAVRHRDESIEKLRAHNEQLRAFHEAMMAAVDAVESNLDALESAGKEAVDADPEPHFERAYDALETHNEAVEGLDTNLTILNAYLV
ncbi:MAG: hypothetical protein ABEH90_06585 [Halolamina sp.]